MGRIHVPKAATVAINVKGADLLFLDHPDVSELEERDLAMWKAAGVDVACPPFGRVIVYVPLQEDGFNRHSLRSNPAADIPGYSETREFTLGIQALWQYLDLFFDKKTTGMTNLLAEIAEYFRETQDQEGFTLADVLHLFKEQMSPAKQKRNERWKDFYSSTIQSVAQRFRSLPAVLGGLIDITGRGFGLDKLADLQPYDMIVIDIERIMTHALDHAVAESTIKIITAYVLKQLTEAMTQRTCQVDHIIVFADELNTLAPRDGNRGIGEYLAQIARSTRDRGIVLFGAGQFRSGMNEDILKAAAMHYSMQTPEDELGDRMYTQLSRGFKARLTQLRPGETLLQCPSLRTAVFAYFPRPFVLSGATKWLRTFPPILRRDLAECVTERLRRLAPQSPPPQDEVEQLLKSLFALCSNTHDKKALEQGIIETLRDIEIEWAHHGSSVSTLPWQQFSDLVMERYGKHATSHTSTEPLQPPPSFFDDKEEWI
jgi:hypothetical protein